MTNRAKLGRVGACAGSMLAAAWLVGCDSPAPKAEPTVKARETIRKTTQEVMRLKDALDQGGQIATGGGEVGPSGGYLGDIAKAKRSIEGQSSSLAVQKAMQAHEILNGPIKSYEEFMELIIKKGQPDGMQLPTLPYYQEFAYDEENRALVVVEFPQRKKDYEAQNK
jgi:hypothetical protein